MKTCIIRKTKEGSIPEIQGWIDGSCVAKFVKDADAGWFCKFGSIVGVRFDDIDVYRRMMTEIKDIISSEIDMDLQKELDEFDVQPFRENTTKTGKKIELTAALFQSLTTILEEKGSNTLSWRGLSYTIGTAPNEGKLQEYLFQLID